MHNRSSLLLALFFAMLITVGCKTTYTHDTEESLAQSFFKIVQKKDRPALEKMKPTKEDMLYVMSVSDIPEESRAMMTEKIENDQAMIWQELNQRMDNHWNSLFEDMAEDGFDPRKATYQKSVVNPQNEKEFLTSDIDILVDFESATYRIRIEEAGKVPRGWLIGGDGFTWKGRYEE